MQGAGVRSLVGELDPTCMSQLRSLRATTKELQLRSPRAAKKEPASCNYEARLLQLRPRATK